MDCQTCREAVSARIDGEPEPIPAAETDRHLHDCADCRHWQARAIGVTRAARVREAAATPDLTATILSLAPVPVSTRGWWARLALGVVAVAQVSLGLAQVLGIQHTGHDPLAGHLFNESTAWNLAIGVGLFWSVFRPRAAAGLLPALGVFVLVLLGFSTHDLITGAAPATRIAGHGLLIAALLLLLVVHRQNRHPAPEQPHGIPEVPATPTHRAAESTSDDEPGPDERHPPLRPVGRHRVA